MHHLFMFFILFMSQLFEHMYTCTRTHARFYEATCCAISNDHSSPFIKPLSSSSSYIGPKRAFVEHQQPSSLFFSISFFFPSYRWQNNYLTVNTLAQHTIKYECQGYTRALYWISVMSCASNSRERSHSHEVRIGFTCTLVSRIIIV